MYNQTEVHYHEVGAQRARAAVERVQTVLPLTPTQREQVNPGMGDAWVERGEADAADIPAGGLEAFVAGVDAECESFAGRAAFVEQAGAAADYAEGVRRRAAASQSGKCDRPPECVPVGSMYDVADYVTARGENPPAAPRPLFHSDAGAPHTTGELQCFGANLAEALCVGNPTQVEELLQGSDVGPLDVLAALAAFVRSAVTPEEAAVQIPAVRTGWPLGDGLHVLRLAVQGSPADLTDLQRLLGEEAEDACYQDYLGASVELAITMVCAPDMFDWFWEMRDWCSEAVT